MDETKMNVCDKETKFSELMGRITDIVHNLGEARNRLNCLSDRLIGCVPETALGRENAPSREGAIGQLEDKVDSLRNEIDETIEAIDRIVNSGVV